MTYQQATMILATYRLPMTVKQMQDFKLALRIAAHSWGIGA